MKTVSLAKHQPVQHHHQISHNKSKLKSSTNSSSCIYQTTQNCWYVINKGKCRFKHEDDEINAIDVVDVVVEAPTTPWSSYLNNKNHIVDEQNSNENVKLDEACVDDDAVKNNQNDIANENSTSNNDMLNVAYSHAYTQIYTKMYETMYEQVYSSVYQSIYDIVQRQIVIDINTYLYSNLYQQMYNEVYQKAFDQALIDCAERMRIPLQSLVKHPSKILKYQNALNKSVSKLLIASTYDQKQVHFIVNLLLKFSEHDIVDMIVDEHFLKQSVDQVLNKNDKKENSEIVDQNKNEKSMSKQKIAVSINADNVDENTFKNIIEQIRNELSAKKTS